MGRKKTNQENLVQNREPSSSMLTRKSKSDQQAEITNKVFNNPMLMNKIVKYSIHKPNGKKLDTKSIVSIRLVNKRWLQSASDTLKNSGHCVIRLVIDGLSEVNRRNKTILDNFVSVFSKASRSTDSILPINFRTMEHFLEKYNTKALFNFFEQFGDMISSLCVFYPLDGGSMNFKRDSLNFSILKSFEFYFDTWRDPLKDLRRAAISGNNTNGLAFLQQVLQNSPNLQHFYVGLSDDQANVNVSSISLPNSVKRLSLGSPFTGNSLILATNNPLQNLNSLTLEIGKESEEIFVYKILEHFRQQSESLVLSVVELEEDSCIIVKFPLMEKLTYLKLHGEVYPFLSQLQPTVVPNLTRLVFQEGLPQSAFSDWVQGSRFENVEKLKFSLNSDDKDSYAMMSPSVQIFKDMIPSFLNIKKLTLRYLISDISSLKYLFRNVPNLRKLSLSFELGSKSYKKLKPAYNFVATFLGISLELATAMVRKTVKNVKVAVDNPESIMNLTELNSLTLRSLPKYSYLSERYRNVKTAKN